MKYYRVVALKELNLTEGKATGFPIIRAEMAKNGSPVPVFYTDDERTLFLVTLPCHPELIWTGMNDGVNDGVNDSVNSLLIDGLVGGLNESVRVEIIRIVNIILRKDGINAREIALQRRKSKPSIERYLRTAKQVGVIEFRGAPKTGGYFLTEKMHSKIKGMTNKG